MPGSNRVTKVNNQKVNLINYVHIRQCLTFNGYPIHDWSCLSRCIKGFLRQPKISIFCWHSEHLNMKTAVVLILALCASAMVSANSCSDTCLAKYTACEQSCRDMWAHSHQYDTCATSCTDERAFCDSKCHGGHGK